jgi:hypothetical protein
MILTKACLYDLKVGDVGTLQRSNWKCYQHFKVKHVSESYVIFDKSFSGDYSDSNEFCLKKCPDTKHSTEILRASMENYNMKASMMNTEFKYKKVKGGYVLTEDYHYMGKVKPTFMVKHNFFQIYQTGLVIVKKGYFWNGANIVKDTKKNLRASCVHDAYCQALGWYLIPMKPYRQKSDETFSDICKEDGMSKFVAGLYYLGLRVYGLVAFGA